MTAKPGRLCLHGLEWPSDGVLTLDFPAKPVKAWLLADRSPCIVAQDEGVMTLSVPASAPDPVDSVIVVENDTTQP